MGSTHNSYWSMEGPRGSCRFHRSKSHPRFDSQRCISKDHPRCYGKIHHFIAGKINYFDWAIFNSFLYVYQRVNPNDNVFIYFHDSATTLQNLHASGGLARRCTSFCSAVPETQKIRTARPNQHAKTILRQTSKIRSWFKKLDLKCPMPFLCDSIAFEPIVSVLRIEPRNLPWCTTRSSSVVAVVEALSPNELQAEEDGEMVIFGQRTNLWDFFWHWIFGPRMGKKGNKLARENEVIGNVWMGRKHVPSGQLAFTMERSTIL